MESGRVTEMSLDHDLGLIDGDREHTGYDVLTWLEERVAIAGFRPPTIHVHSANPVGRRRMEMAIASIQRHARQT